MAKIFTWCTRNLSALVTGLVAVIAAVVFWNRHRDQVDSLKDRVIVEKGHREIAKLEGQRVLHMHSAVRHAAELRRLRDEIQKTQKRVVATKENVTAMDDAAVAAEFKRRYKKWREKP